MNADQALNTVKTLLTQVTTWARLVAGLIFALLLLATLCSMSGHPIPYIPAIRAGMQELGVFTAGLAYALWR